MREIIIQLHMWVMNYLVAYIPIWPLRKLFYKLSGMKIGKYSHISMGCFVYCPWKISIGNETYINEKCVLDGRGGLTIGNYVNLSYGSAIFTGAHDIKSSSFAYKRQEVEIKDMVWLCANAMVMPGSLIEEGVVVTAGSVATKNKSLNEGYKAYKIYMGNPAVEVGNREIDGQYMPEVYKPHFK